LIGLPAIQVKEKRAELEKLKSTFVRRASEFLRNYFASLVDFMISDKSYFSQVFYVNLLQKWHF
jgi:hypothetical protein